MPDFFRNKGNKGMKQYQCVSQHTPQYPLRRILPFLSRLAVEVGFDRFEIPVAEFMPDKLVQRSRGIVETISIKTIGNRVCLSLGAVWTVSIGQEETVLLSANRKQKVSPLLRSYSSEQNAPRSRVC